MKQARFAAFGPPAEVIECVEVDDVGAPGADEAVVDIDAFPINPADLLTITGDYAARPELPATLGAEAVGTVAATGAAVTGLKAGDRVILLGRDNWTQRRRVRANTLVKVAADSDVQQIAMLKVNPATAALLLQRYVDLADGEWVIQNAANSGVGLNLIRLAGARGQRTVNVVRRPDLIDPLRAHGGDVVLVDGDDLAERVAAATDGASIRLAIDAVAGRGTLTLSECLADGGTVVNYGLLSGAPCMVHPDRTVFHGLTLTGFWLAPTLGAMPCNEIVALYTDLEAKVRDGTLHVPVEAAYPLAEIKDAVAHAAREGRGGKVLVTPNEA